MIDYGSNMKIICCCKPGSSIVAYFIQTDVIRGILFFSNFFSKLFKINLVLSFFFNQVKKKKKVWKNICNKIQSYSNTEISKNHLIIEIHTRTIFFNLNYNNGYNRWQSHKWLRNKINNWIKCFTIRNLKLIINVVVLSMLDSHNEYLIYLLLFFAHLFSLSFVCILMVVFIY